MTIVPNEEQDSFGVFAAKSLVLSTITTMSVVLGFAAAGHVVITVERLNKKRKAKKEAQKMSE